VKAITSLLLLALLVPAAAAAAQNPLPDAPEPAVTVRATPLNLLKDQEAIWTSPARLNASNAAVPILAVLATTVVATTDHEAMSHIIAKDASLKSKSDTASQGLMGGFLVAPMAFYGMGRLHHDEHATETGILGGEAIADSLAVNEVAKLIARRERPTVDGAKGKFFQPGVTFDSSFPSDHAVIAWSSAAVIASEYPGILTKITAYGLASGVSLTRVLAQQHVPSDVVAGSAVGWMIGRYVVRKHHRHSLD
jgi:membrane-associated phospholipid phosphatase